MKLPKAKQGIETFNLFMTTNSKKKFLGWA